MVFVTKANGERETFDKNKIINTVTRAGVDEKNAKQIANKIAGQVKDGESTHSVYKKILRELNKLESKAPFHYRLREAVSHLGPMIFERYVKKILEFNGFKCRLDQIIRGKLVEHEVDVVAEKDGKKIMVECKRHVNPHRFTSLGVMMTVWARLDDLIKGGKNFTNAWLITNTKFSEHAKRYAKGKNMFYTGWNLGGDHDLDDLIIKNKLYPVTLLKTDETTVKKLIDNDIITIQDILKAKTLPVALSRAEDLITQAQKLAK